MSEDHPQHVATWLGEVFGGPPRYTEEHGGYPHMLAKHRDRALTEPQRRRWVELICDAADAAGLPSTTPSSAPRSSPTSSGGRGSRWPTRSRARPRRRRRRSRTGAGARRRRTCRSIGADGDRDHHRLGHLRAARVRWRRSRAGRHPLGRDARLARHRRRRRRRARLAARRRPCPALEPRDAPGQHRGAVGARRRGRGRGHGLRRGRPGRRARVADLLRRPALPGQPPAGRLALHVLCRGRRSAPGPSGSSRTRSRPRCGARCSTQRDGAGWRCATAAATATSTARASTPAPRSAGWRRPA